mmetsp:Transcript_35570/g.70323  ORF Transcript_35570/g.70323 Transcript_35570/m.70323 type:complete len:91 (+) Transcript_35570:79-351(+)
MALGMAHGDLQLLRFLDMGVRRQRQDRGVVPDLLVADHQMLWHWYATAESMEHYRGRGCRAQVLRQAVELWLRGRSGEPEALRMSPRTGH